MYLVRRNPEKGESTSRILEMDDLKQSAISYLRQTLEGNKAAIRALEVRNAELQAVIRQLEEALDRLEPRQLQIPISASGDQFAAMVERQERAVENDELYSAEKFKGKQRIAIAVALAKDFGGYISTSAFRKVLSKPGVLKSTSQIVSVASRVLANSDEFERVWEGVYKLKNFLL